MLGKGGTKVTLKLWSHSLIETCLHHYALLLLLLLVFALPG